MRNHRTKGHRRGGNDANNFEGLYEHTGNYFELGVLPLNALDTTYKQTYMKNGLRRSAAPGEVRFAPQRKTKEDYDDLENMSH